MLEKAKNGPVRKGILKNSKPLEVDIEFESLKNGLSVKENKDMVRIGVVKGI